MEIRDNRIENSLLSKVPIIKGNISVIYHQEGGSAFITLDTGYDVILEAQELRRIVENLNKREN